MMCSRNRWFTKSCGLSSLIAGCCVVHRCRSQDVHRTRFLCFSNSKIRGNL